MDNNQQTAYRAAMYDPQTGQRLEKPLQMFDPFTGQPLQLPEPKYDIYTGQPLDQPAPKFDIHTGQPLNQPAPRFDIHTGQPLNQPPPRFDIHTGQPLQGAQSVPPIPPVPPQNANQAAYHGTPARTSAENKKEFFIGINLLSKIGVVFIIIGVIAFSAVSETFLSPLARTLIIFALGLLMTGLGEVFYRFGSRIFARALTIGGIGELAVSTLIGYGAFSSLNELAALFIGITVAAGGILLAVRYNSQTIMAVSAVCGFLPCFPAFSEVPSQIIAIFAVLLFQIAVLAVTYRKKWHTAMFFAVAANAVITVALYIAMAHDIAMILCPAYTSLSFSVYIAAAVIKAFRGDNELCLSGNLPAAHTGMYVSALTLLTTLNLFFLGVNDAAMAFGFISLFFAAAFIATAAAAKKVLDTSPIIKMNLNAAVTLICLAIFTIFSGDLVYIIFHICAAALLILGYLKNIRFVKTWGIITCSFAEFYFVFFCIAGIGTELFIFQFAVNSLLWLIIMTVLAMKGVRGAGFTAFTIIALVNAALMGCYMLTRLSSHLADIDVLPSGRAAYTLMTLGCALVWMIAAFITGKLKFIGKARSVTAIIIYAVSMICLFNMNILGAFVNFANEMICVVLSLAVNLISVAAALDMAFSIKELAPRFARAIGLVVSVYAMFSVTFALGTNRILAFTSCFISIFYLVVAVAWIVWGFARKFPLMRRFGLALTLLASAKLFLFDFAGIDAVARTVMFILFGIVLLVVSFIYALFESRLKKQAQAEQQQSQN